MSRAHTAQPRVLVTGGAGYIGSHTCKALAEAGYQPIVYNNLSQGHHWAVKWGPLLAHDLSDGCALQNVFKEFAIKAVIHFAAHAYVGESVVHPRKYFNNNVISSITLLDALVDASIDCFVFHCPARRMGTLEGFRSMKVTSRCQ